MDALINAAGHALASGDVLGALKRVALRDDPPALALRGIVMAQLGDLDRAKALLKRAARGFGRKEAVARARCVVAEAEIALVSRDLGWPARDLRFARLVLEAHGDHVNAVHARNIEARRLLLICRLDAAEELLAGIDPTPLPAMQRAGFELVMAGIAIRRLRSSAARAALARAERAANEAGNPALQAEVASAAAVLARPAARLIAQGQEKLISLGEVEALLASDALIVDACRYAVRGPEAIVRLSTRPVLFSLMRALAKAWPEDVSREVLLARAFGARHADESHRARLRVEIARLRREIEPLAQLSATAEGFVLSPQRAPGVAVLAPPVEERNGHVLALLADGEAWSSSALAMALGTSARTVQRALEQLSDAGKVQAIGCGRARRWTTPSVPGFPTALLLPGPLPNA